MIEKNWKYLYSLEKKRRELAEKLLFPLMNTHDFTVASLKLSPEYQQWKDIIKKMDKFKK